MEMGDFLRRGPIVALALVGAASAQEAGKDVEDLLAHMRNAYRSVKSAAFTTKSRFGARSFTSTFFFRSPSNIRVDVINPQGKDFKSSLVKISDGKQIATKPAKEFAYGLQPYSIDAFSATVPVNLESLCFYDWEKQLSTAAGKNMHDSTFKIMKGVAWNGKKWMVLEETAKKQNVICHYFVDPKTFLIWRTTVGAIGAAEITQDNVITKMNPAAAVPDSKFELPPDHP